MVGCEDGGANGGVGDNQDGGDKFGMDGSDHGGVAVKNGIAAIFTARIVVGW